MVEWIALLVAGMTLVGTLVNAFFTRQVKVHINSRMSELLELTEKAAHAEGKKESDVAAAGQIAASSVTASTAAAAAVASEIVAAGVAAGVKSTK